MILRRPVIRSDRRCGIVMAAREVMILCNGHNKARALQAAIEGPVTQAWTISALQTHPCGIIVCDDAATDELKVSTYRYFKDIEKKQSLKNVCYATQFKFSNRT